MTEELVTLGTARLLREKSFNEPCMIAINIEDSRQYGANRTNSELPIKVCAQPSQSIAQKWLREKHGIHVVVDFNQWGKWYCRVYYLEGSEFICETEKFSSYEIALEAGIQEVLKLI